MQICLNVKCPVFLGEFNGTWIFSVDFGKTYRCENSWKFFQCEASSSMRTDGQRETDRWSWYSLFAILRTHLWMTLKWSSYRPGVAQRVGRGIALLFHDRSTSRGWVVSSTPRPHFTPGKEPVPILQAAWWVPGPVWTTGKSRPHRDSITDRPYRSQSLYRLSYRAHLWITLHLLNFNTYTLLMVSAIYVLCVCVRACVRVYVCASVWERAHARPCTFEAGFVASFEVTSRQAECYLIIT